MAQVNHHHDPSSSHEHECAHSLFVQHNIRCTKPRVLIFDALLATRSHPTAEELHAIVKDSDPGISLATIYNTLELLVQHGLARRIANRSPGSGANRYDADRSPHLHLILNDGTVLDAPHDLTRKINSAIPQELLDQLALHAGVDALKIEIVEDSHASQHA